MAKGKTAATKEVVVEHAAAAKAVRTEAELWSEVATLPRQKIVYKKACKNGRSLLEFTTDKGVVDTDALDTAVAAAKEKSKLVH